MIPKNGHRIFEKVMRKQKLDHDPMQLHRIIV
jgi:hypothetical protein